MLKPLANDVMKKNDNCYSFVVGIAKRARQLSEVADAERVEKAPADYSELTQKISEEKAVTLALEEFKKGDFSIHSAQ